MRRLLGSGIEYFTYSTAITVFSLIGILTGGLLGLLWVPLLLIMIGMRDLNAGAFSLGKRVGGLRVVDLRSAQPPSNPQALLRNSYYLALVFLMLIPVVKYPIAGLFFTVLVLDTLMVIASPTGRRIGDHLAGTQVVSVANAPT